MHLNACLLANCQREPPLADYSPRLERKPWFHRAVAEIHNKRGTIMRIGKCIPNNGLTLDASHCGWHRLILDAEGRVTGASGNIEQLLGIQICELTGQCVSAILPGIPLSKLTPGYNLAYAVFNRARTVSHNARDARGDGITVDAVLSSHRDGHAHGIALALRAHVT